LLLDTWLLLTVFFIQIFAQDTAELGLRFGLNSGPTTAGVLRGEKGRFQLFGDTVNTAARMEHHGEVHRIQVSPSTAESLRADGKAHWLTPRVDLVHAKGKGAMQTYWCEPMVSGEESVQNSEDPHFLPPEDLEIPTEETKSGDEEEGSVPAHSTDSMNENKKKEEETVNVTAAFHGLSTASQQQQ
jgi:hypothetical protein